MRRDTSYFGQTIRGFVNPPDYYEQLGRQAQSLFCFMCGHFTMLVIGEGELMRARYGCQLPAHIVSHDGQEARECRSCEHYVDCSDETSREEELSGTRHSRSPREHLTIGEW